MGMRFKILSALYLVLLLLANDSGVQLIDGVADVFVGLGGLLILCVLALWPNASRADRVDRAIDGSSWADRVDIESFRKES
jgi:hypothetical protein